MRGFFRNHRCWCGHPRNAHDHYRAGTECSQCTVCAQFSWHWWPANWGMSGELG
jgi:hypothetical protein